MTLCGENDGCQEKFIRYSAANVSPAPSTFVYARSLSSPSKPASSHLPYQGSMQTNGAFFPSGDQMANSGASNRTVT